MRNKIIAIFASLLLAASPVTTVNGQTSGAAGGMSVGTAVAIGVVGAALLVALGDSSSSAPAAVTPPAETANSSTSTTSVTTSVTTTTSTN
tara:strand:- start:86 stop:358 length:273 start_codon:yes stop_codon:yes gene_type:complete